MCVSSTTPEDTQSMSCLAFVKWSVYIILCTDNTFYTGIAVDVTKRFNQHAAGQGAKYFRGET